VERPPPHPIHHASGSRDETRRFFEFLRTEMPLLIERWQQHR